MACIVAALLATRPAEANTQLRNDNWNFPPRCLADPATKICPLPRLESYRTPTGSPRWRRSTRKYGGSSPEPSLDATGTRAKRILDEFVALTGYHRKHAIRLLNEADDRPIMKQRRRSRIYDEAVEQALIVLWEAADRICGKRLRPLLPTLIDALERHGHLQLDGVVREKLLTISAASIDRLLRPAKEKTRRPRRKPPAVRGKIPVRTFADWQDPGPGFMEIDLVAHCGGGVGGRYAHTLVLTDICSGWTECIALAVRDSALVVQALDHVADAMPFPLRGIDSDNGSEFINDGLLSFCQARSIEFTRSRPYRKNDQAWVEQKNGAVVRRMVGYGRLSGLAAAEALARLYASTRLFVNFFQPSFKLLSKERVGAKLRKRYQTPMTPCARLLESTELDAGARERLQAVQVTIDPLRLLDEIRSMQGHLAGLANGEHIHVPPHRDADLDEFLRTLQHAWRRGEVRPTHQPKPKRERYWRTRADPTSGECEGGHLIVSDR